MFSKVAAHAFEAGDFLNIFLKVLRGFEAHIFTKSFSYKKKTYSRPRNEQVNATKCLY